MRSGCINHPGKESLLIVRAWQLEATDGHKAAAALLSFLEYWHDVKISMSAKNRQANDTAEAHGDHRTQDESLLQWHTGAELKEGLLGLFGDTKISEGVKLLEEKGFVSVHANPNPRYKFDKTRYFLFDAETVNDWLNNRSRNSTESSLNSKARLLKTNERSGNSKQPIAETSSETSGFDLLETNVSLFGEKEGATKGKSENQLLMDQVYERFKEAGYSVSEKEYGFNLGAIKKMLVDDGPTPEEIEALPDTVVEYFDIHAKFNVRQALRYQRQQKNRRRRIEAERQQRNQESSHNGQDYDHEEVPRRRYKNVNPKTEEDLRLEKDVPRGAQRRWNG